jgi:site-specific DNA-methyltransferase (adenine-specific)
MANYTVHIGDCIESMKKMPDGSINTCITSPPYFGLRDYGHDGQIGLEPTPDEFVAALVAVFREVKRVLRDDGTVWLNLGDSYAKNKQLIGVPWKVAFALQSDGWILRQEIIWAKGISGEGSKNWAGACMPEPVKNRCVKSHEHIFLLSKSNKYFFDYKAIKEPNRDPTRTNYSPGKRAYAEGNTEQIPGDRTRRNDGFEKYANGEIPVGRNRRSVWAVSTRPYSGAHFATFPPNLIEPCVLAGCPEGGTVLDPFGGSGTTAGVALKHNRNAVLCELNPKYADIIPDRIESITAIQKPKKQRKFTPEEQQLLL